MGSYIQKEKRFKAKTAFQKDVKGFILTSCFVIKETTAQESSKESLTFSKHPVQVSCRAGYGCADLVYYLVDNAFEKQSMVHFF